MLRNLIDYFVTSKSSTPAAAYLCLDRYLQVCRKPSVDAEPIDVLDWLHAFVSWTRSVRILTCDPALCHNARIGWLFGFSATAAHSFRLLRGGRAFQLMRSDKATSQQRPDSMRDTTEEQLSAILTRYFTSQVLEHVAEVLDAYGDLDVISTVSSRLAKEKTARLQIILCLILVEDSLRGLRPLFRHQECIRYVSRPSMRCLIDTE